jgi:hypothetical protein
MLLVDIVCVLSLRLKDYRRPTSVVGEEEGVADITRAESRSTGEVA